MAKKTKHTIGRLRKRDAVVLMKDYIPTTRGGAILEIVSAVLLFAFVVAMLVIGDWGPLDVALTVVIGVASGIWAAAYIRPREERGLIAAHGDYHKFMESHESAQVKTARMFLLIPLWLVMMAVLLLAIRVVGRDSHLLGRKSVFEIFFVSVLAQLVNALLFLRWYRHLPD